jgi:hypothetical protein
MEIDAAGTATPIAGSAVAPRCLGWTEAGRAYLLFEATERGAMALGADPTTVAGLGAAMAVAYLWPQR